MKKAGIFLILMSTVLFRSECFAQSDYLLSFTAVQKDNIVHLAFTIRGGVTCLGTQIERSVDGMHFEPIGEIPGVCGSSDYNVAYAFDDSLPLVNQTNFYRLQLGTLGYSNIISTSFIDYTEGVQIIPNPVADQTIIYFSNPSYKAAVLSLYDANGRRSRVIYSNNNFIQLFRNKLPSGNYFFTIEIEGEKKYNGKLQLL